VGVLTPAAGSIQGYFASAFLLFPGAEQAGSSVSVLIAAFEYRFVFSRYLLHCGGQGFKARVVKFAIGIKAC
jgi:hypothetical protein